MEAVAIITVLALAQFIFFGFQVGAARGKAGIRAPAITGEPTYERRFRVHQNTMEQLVVFVPALWLFAHYINPLWGAGIGVVYLLGRFLYSAAYVEDPAKRGMGFTMSFLPTVVMLIWVLATTILSYF
jgi:uncharacterized MAPEG superfamily protein